MTRVSVDADRCVGHGRCYSLAPRIYDSDDVGHSVVLVADVSGELEQQALVGAQNCPEEAITLTP
ncbi:ferredoxin [Mycobacterium paragordonae]|jgi:ferredoxin|uniref:Ferredoxin n=1 Tax=Mycobacterium paragordonae TaxID=1389713 RepID=A0A386U5W7_9MYCO|nr:MULTISPECIES: ferredoxin [Mycobacterium]AYE95943.1 ferredoxin [Mycobacterium paragordonae]MDP7734976.1 ferredoxin [Mycobacterium paragordonae]OBJ75763.1 cytochrome [Mycobacterium gordonae]OBK48674.1 cytochrome [Mycobacterium gordonae]TDK96369.1 ferredoxin [Mycobacterium paragordonae]